MVNEPSHTLINWFLELWCGPLCSVTVHTGYDKIWCKDLQSNRVPQVDKTYSHVKHLMSCSSVWWPSRQATQNICWHGRRLGASRYPSTSPQLPHCTTNTSSSRACAQAIAWAIKCSLVCKRSNSFYQWTIFIPDLLLM